MIRASGNLYSRVSLHFSLGLPIVIYQPFGNISDKIAKINSPCDCINAITVIFNACFVGPASQFILELSRNLFETGCRRLHRAARIRIRSHSHRAPISALPISAARLQLRVMRTKLTVFTAHVDNESQRIANADWPCHSSSSGPVTVSDFHVALRWLQGEDYGISRGDPGRRWVRKRQEECVSVISCEQPTAYFAPLDSRC